MSTRLPRQPIPFASIDKHVRGRTHYAIINSSGRVIDIEKCGQIFWVLHEQTPHQMPSAYVSVSGPFRRKDKRFTILERAK